MCQVSPFNFRRIPYSVVRFPYENPAARAWPPRATGWHHNCYVISNMQEISMLFSLFQDCPAEGLWYNEETMSAPGILDSLAVLNSELNLDQLLQKILDISVELTHAERAFLMLYDENEELALKAARSRQKKDLSENEFKGSRTIIQKVLQDRQPFYIPCISDSKELVDKESVRSMSLKSALCVPIWSSRIQEPAGSLLGLLYMDSSALVSPLSQEHLQLMQALANHVAISIENAKLFEELGRKNEELKTKNTEIASLNSQLQQAVEIQAGSLADMRSLFAESRRELSRVYGLGNIVGKAQPMEKVFKILEKVVHTDATVLILGESGTGKELIARYIHYNSGRSEVPMVSINCSAFNDTLLESELFGHRKGAFTGANENKGGLFQLADRGTLFLDEVGDMSAEMQKKLLRVLQDGEVRPVGSREVFKVDVRIIAATNRILKELVQQGKFREDLYFRLNVIKIELPPLRQRRDDIPLLIEYFSQKIAGELKSPVKKLSESILKQFLEHDWPGNVRELENELRRVFILESEYEFESETAPQVSSDDSDLRMESIERNAILKALEATGGNKSKAAEVLGMARRTFYDKLEKYKIG